MVYIKNINSKILKLIRLSYLKLNNNNLISIMDISKFNEQLREKISIAKRFEKQGSDQDLKDAIKVWIDISEMILRVSRNPKIERTFRNMLINKTEQIISHVKDLKSNKRFSIEEISYHDEISDVEEVQEEELPAVKVAQQEEVKAFPNEEEIGVQMHDQIESPRVETERPRPTNSNGVEVIENSEFKNLPDGFKEIKPSNGFKILTPHDEDHIKNMLKQANDSPFENQEDSNLENVPNRTNFKIELSEKNENGNLICFACGAVVPPDSKECNNCGAQL